MNAVARFRFGASVGVNVYAGSGPPVSKLVRTRNNAFPFVDGRGSLGRIDFLSNTDLLLRQDIRLGGGGRLLQLELNVLNVFDQKQARHVFSFVNRNVNGSRINMTSVDLTQGYDYQALLAQTPDAAKPPSQNASGYADPRYLMADQRNPGLHARFSARVLF